MSTNETPSEVTAAPESAAPVTPPVAKKRRAPLTLKGGIVVNPTSEIAGGVKYTTKPIELSAEEQEKLKTTPEAAVVRNLSTKVTDNPDEHDKALKVRAAAIKLVSDQGTRLGPGIWLVAHANEAALDTAIDAAEAMINAFNSSATFSRIDFWAPKLAFVDSGQSEKIACSIAEEIQRILADMKDGIEARDADAIKASMKRAKRLNAMIDETSQEHVSKAIQVAKNAAKEITDTIKFRGNAALVLAADTHKQLLEDIKKTFTVLDLDPIVVPVEVTSPVSVNELDMDMPATDSPILEAAAPAGAGALDMDDLAPIASIVEKTGPEELGDVDNLGDPDASKAVDADGEDFKNAMAADSNGDNTGIEF